MGSRIAIFLAFIFIFVHNVLYMWYICLSLCACACVLQGGFFRLHMLFFCLKAMTFLDCVCVCVFFRCDSSAGDLLLHLHSSAGPRSSDLQRKFSIFDLTLEQKGRTVCFVSDGSNMEKF